MLCTGERETCVCMSVVWGGGGVCERETLYMTERETISVRMNRKLSKLMCITL